MDAYSFLSVALVILPCSSLILDHRVDFFTAKISIPNSHFLVVGVWIVIGIVAIALLASYIFYPAYANHAGGGLSCTATVLVGEKKDMRPGKVPIQLAQFYYYVPHQHSLSNATSKLFIHHTDNILSLIIPAYNEAERLPIMLDSTLRFLDTNRIYLTEQFNAIGSRDAKSSNTQLQYEFIIVNDGSTDDTENIVRTYAANNIMYGDIVKLISMHKNCGKGGAVKTGMLHSSGQLCLMIDADGATEISDGLPKVLHEMKRLYDGISLRSDNATTTTSTTSSNFYLPRMAVFGSRAHLEEESTASRSKIRTFLMHAFHFFVKILCSPHIKDTQCGFKLFTRSAAVMLFTNLHLRRW